MEIGLSCEKELGLQLKTLAAGKAYIVTGGTGILPFGDLIDLLFKEEYVKQYPQFRDRFCKESPILACPLL